MMKLSQNNIQFLGKVTGTAPKTLLFIIKRPENYLWSHWKLSDIESVTYSYIDYVYNFNKCYSSLSLN